jgi:hypothetical protein
MARRVTVGGMGLLVGIFVLLVVLVPSGSRLAAIDDATPEASPTLCAATSPDQNRSSCADTGMRCTTSATRAGRRIPRRRFVRNNAGRPQTNEPGNTDDIGRARENLA